MSQMHHMQFDHKLKGYKSMAHGFGFTKVLTTKKPTARLLVRDST